MPKLVRGQVAPGVSRKSDRLRTGIRKRIDRLNELVAHFDAGNELTEDAYIPIPTALALREWEEPEHGIYRIGSPATFAKYVSGTDDLEIMKRLAIKLWSYANGKLPRAPSAAGQYEREESLADLRRKIRDLNHQYQAVLDDLVLLRIMYVDLVAEMEADDQLRTRTRDAIRRHKQLYGMYRVVAPPSNLD